MLNQTGISYNFEHQFDDGVRAEIIITKGTTNEIEILLSSPGSAYRFTYTEVSDYLFSLKTNNLDLIKKLAFLLGEIATMMESK